MNPQNPSLASQARHEKKLSVDETVAWWFWHQTELELWKSDGTIRDQLLEKVPRTDKFELWDRCRRCGGKCRLDDVLFPGGWRGPVRCLCQLPEIKPKIANAVAALDTLTTRENNVGFDSLQPRDEPGWRRVETAIAALKDLAVHPWRSRWITILGTTGIGKTTMVLALKCALPGIAAYVYVPDLADRLYHAIQTDEVSDIKTMAAAVPILILDDLGSEPNTPFISSALDYIVSARYNNSGILSTIVTSNLPRDALYEWIPRVGSRVLDVGTDLVTVFPLNLPDYRRLAAKTQALSAKHGNAAI